MTEFIVNKYYKSDVTNVTHKVLWKNDTHVLLQNIDTIDKGPVVYLIKNCSSLKQTKEKRTVWVNMYIFRDVIETENVYEDKEKAFASRRVGRQDEIYLGAFPITVEID